MSSLLYIVMYMFNCNVQIWRQITPGSFEQIVLFRINVCKYINCSANTAEIMVKYGHQLGNVEFFEMQKS